MQTRNKSDKKYSFKFKKNYNPDCQRQYKITIITKFSIIEANNLPYSPHTDVFLTTEMSFPRI